MASEKMVKLVNLLGDTIKEISVEMKNKTNSKETNSCGFCGICEDDLYDDYDDYDDYEDEDNLYDLNIASNKLSGLGELLNYACGNDVCDDDDDDYSMCPYFDLYDEGLTDYCDDCDVDHDCFIYGDGDDFDDEHDLSCENLGLYDDYYDEDEDDYEDEDEDSELINLLKSLGGSVVKINFA